MKCLHSSVGSNIAYLTSTTVTSTLLNPVFCNIGEMEAENCVRMSEACRATSLNGCVKNHTTAMVVADDNIISNNNTTNSADPSRILSVDDVSSHANSGACISNNGTTAVESECDTGSRVLLESNISHSLLPDKDSNGHSSECEKSSGANAPDVANSARGTDNQGSSTTEVKEISSTLSQLVLKTEAVGVSEVPLSEALVENSSCDRGNIRYIVYESERQMEDIMRLITKDLSEPYSIYTYRYFIHNWPRLCYLAMDDEKCIGAIVCKLDRHRSSARRGYIAMLAVDQDYRRYGIGSNLVVQAIRSMLDPCNGGCDEVVLETEISNSAALRLYEKLGFVRDKRLFRYYLNGVDALRLKLWLK